MFLGKKASKDERSGAMKNALDFVKDNGYSPTTKIQVEYHNILHN